MPSVLPTGSTLRHAPGRTRRPDHQRAPASAQDVADFGQQIGLFSRASP
jgi:hypothetical protein